MSAADDSNGWDAVADQLIQARRASRIGVDVLQQWCRELAPGTAVLDLGCGAGEPVALLLHQAGFAVHGVDASPRLIAAFRQRLPGVPAECAPVETATSLQRRFGGIVAIGLLFLLGETGQRQLLRKMAAALEPGGHLLFTAPWQVCSWEDLLTRRQSRSLGAAVYTALLQQAGLTPGATTVDEGGNHYFTAQRPP